MATGQTIIPRHGAQHYFVLVLILRLPAFQETFKITSPVQRRRPVTPHDNMSMESFDSLKREATKLERQLEDKVSRYQQVRWSFICLLRASDQRN